jgi:hypothetical protein
LAKIFSITKLLLLLGALTAYALFLSQSFEGRFFRFDSLVMILKEGAK